MKIHIPTPLRAYTEKQETVDVSGATVAAGLQGLIEAFPALRTHLFTPEGKLRSFVNVYVGDEDMRYLPGKEETPVGDGVEVSIVPSIAGGSVAPIGGPDGTMYERTLREVREAEATPDPEEDMAHAKMLLERLTPLELLQATYLLEDFVEQTPAFRQGLAELSDSGEAGHVGMETVLQEYGLK